MRVGQRVDQLSRNPELVTLLADGSFQDVIHVEFVGNIAGAQVLIAVREGR